MRFGTFAAALTGLATTTQACLNYGIAPSTSTSTTTEFGQYFWAPNCLSGYGVEVRVCGPTGACPLSTWDVRYTTPHGTFTWTTTWWPFSEGGHSKGEAWASRFC
ncbi:hypothetical protein QBC34DRAFT_431705 [Podospora aff. communis PSN243]|uniref:Uncharacterized protein n=1 Tax=Podospora aff. communis PSN243 TaxID=3040156 RepID=A0AAV9G4H2_9PEZI|nr:hypothetical protein QBC34DRAFT_431705 [Podospora aff. communis PSN243]